MPTKYYHYTIKLNSPALITQPGGDPNSAEGSCFINGAAIRGLLAGKIAAGTPDFEELILSGKVCYLNTYPICQKERTFPVPISWKKEKKYEDNFHNLAGYSGEKKEKGFDWPEEQLEGMDSPLVTLTAADKYLINPRFVGKFHHQRDREKGRATKEEGAIFSYQALAAEQSFAGVLVINDENPNRLIEKIKAALKPPLLLGRSQRAGYGGNAELIWEAEKESETGKDFLDPKKDEEFCLVLTSDYIGRDSNGQINPTAILEEISKLMEGNAEVIKDRHCWSFGTAGGYNRKWQLPLPQAKTLKAGSVIVLKALKDLTGSELLALTHRGLGERRIDGFGRFIFLAKPEKRVFPKKEPKEPLREEPLSSPVPELINFMQKELLRKAVEDKIKIAIPWLAADFNKDTLPSPSLLGRLRVPLRQGSSGLQTLKDWVINDKLRKTAKEKLNNCRNNKENLFKWLDAVLTKNGKIEELLDYKVLAQDNHLVNQAEAEKILKAADYFDEVRLKLIDNLLAELTHRQKLNNSGEEKNG